MTNYSEETILAQLNESQRQAVLNTEGPLMVIAGAGSGKTRVLTYRIAYMLVRGISPFNILALTFTNKAAAEMKERVVALAGEHVSKAVSMGTFHSIFYRILRIEGSRLGFTRNLTVYDTDDSKGVIRTIVKEMNLDPKTYVASKVLSRISSAKSSLLSAEEYAQSPEIILADEQAHRPCIADIFKRYNARLRNSDAMDFDDLLYYMNVLLRDHPDLLYKYQNRFRYIMVDEYQDTNFAQYLIVKKLASGHHNLCVVGDDAQSIYAFRGANIQNILNFKKDFPTAHVVKLEQNYRSTQTIVQAANAVIKYNKGQIPKEVWTDNLLGQKINLLKTSSESEEAIAIADAIFSTVQNERLAHGQFAILYRTNTQSRALEEALVKRHIPYKIYGGLSFYKRKEIKDVMAYFRLTINHYDEESLMRVINYPVRGIGATTLDRVRVQAHEMGVRTWDVVASPHKYAPSLNSSVKTKLEDFAAKISGFSTMLTTTDAYELGKHILQYSGILHLLKEDISEKERLENVEGLLDAMKEFVEKDPETEFDEDTGELIAEYFPSLDRFLSSVSLLTDEENKDEDMSDKVKLMTIHAAKGLEFDRVFVSGMEENLFPSSLSLASPEELEEERRLFYVAVTRARQTLTLTYAQSRFRFGSLQLGEPSRFIEEIPLSLLNTTEKASSGKGLFHRNRSLDLPGENYATASVSAAPRPTFIPKMTPADAQLQSFGTLATPDDIVPHAKIYHAKFGFGTILDTEDSGENKKAFIEFDTVGKKTLLLKFAKLILVK
jgi:DNA helicase-2/ATP-dependent DNA helicase PcrA